MSHSEQSSQVYRAIWFFFLPTHLLANYKWYIEPSFFLAFVNHFSFKIATVKKKEENWWTMVMKKYGFFFYFIVAIVAKTSFLKLLLPLPFYIWHTCRKSKPTKKQAKNPSLKYQKQEKTKTKCFLEFDFIIFFFRLPRIPISCVLL